MGESLAQYEAAFAAASASVDALLARLGDLVAAPSVQLVLDVLGDVQQAIAFRYLASPPVSVDDLKTLADASLSSKALKDDPARVTAIWDTVRAGLDPMRFPWALQRAPSADERRTAVFSTSALMASQMVTTKRRNESKTKQEAAVFTALEQIGFQRVPKRRVEGVFEAPKPGQWCSEEYLAGRKADVMVGLHDRRILAIECKVSNSATNSVKRLNNDAAAKAETWLKELGPRHVVPAAMLSGVFKLGNLESAQERGLALFWAHDLKAFTDWVEAAR